MSFCRWSSDNFHCDLYAYESANGYVIHVAGRRYLGDIPPFPASLPTLENVQEWLDARIRQGAFLDTAQREAITLPHAGETFTEDTLDDFEARLLYLRRLGYLFPDWVFEEIREERESLPEAEVRSAHDAISP